MLENLNLHASCLRENATDPKRAPCMAMLCVEYGGNHTNIMCPF